MSQGSHRNGSLDAAATDGGEDLAAAAAMAKGEGMSSGGLLDDGGGGGGGGVGGLSTGSIFSLFDSGPGDTVMLSADELSSSLWKFRWFGLCYVKEDCEHET